MELPKKDEPSEPTPTPAAPRADLRDAASADADGAGPRFEAAFEYAAIAMALVSPSGTLLRVNPAICQLLGYSKGELLALSFQRLVHPDDLADDLQLAGRLLSGGSDTGRQETRFLRSSGRAIWAVHHVSLVRDDAGAPRYFVSQIQNITKRKQAQLALRESERQLHQAQALANIGNYVWNVQEETLTWSPQMYRVYGLSPDDPPSVDRVTALVHEDDRETLIAAFEAAFAGLPPRSVTYRIRRPDGVERHIVARAEVELDANGEVLQILGTAQDITEAKRAEAARRAFDAKVQHAQKLESLGVLAGGIAHDFNNMLVSIMGNAGLALLDLPPASPARESIQAIEVAAQRAADLARQMLAYSGKGDFVTETLQLRSVVEEMLHILQVSVSKRAVVTFDFGDDVPPIEADPAQLRQVIMNLVVNASEAIGARGGLITVRTGAMICDRAYLGETYLDDDLPAGYYAYVEVGDSGGGMDPATAARVCEPFFTTKHAGRGLGLAAVLGIVRGHRGALHVSSTPGDGTRLRVLFPAVLGRGQRVAELSGEQGGGPLGGRTVLVVDDDETILGVARRVLRFFGATPIAATSGDEAVELLRVDPQRFDCVVLDLTMPGMSGEDTFAALRVLRADLKVVLSSGYDAASLMKRFAGRGFAGFLQKPYTPDRLRDGVLNALADR